jgi:hypothetical protein
MPAEYPGHILGSAVNELEYLPTDWDRTFLRNVVTFLPNCTASHSREQHVGFEVEPPVENTMEAKCSSETSVNTRSTRRHIPEDIILHSTHLLHILNEGILSFIFKTNILM